VKALKRFVDPFLRATIIVHDHLRPDGSLHIETLPQAFENAQGKLANGVATQL
jgi:hypothetical protein